MRSVQISVLHALLEMGLPMQVEAIEEVSRKITQEFSLGKIMIEQVRDFVIEYHTYSPEQAEELVDSLEEQNQKDLASQMQASKNYALQSAAGSTAGKNGNV